MQFCVYVFNEVNVFRLIVFLGQVDILFWNSLQYFVVVIKKSFEFYIV